MRAATTETHTKRALVGRIGSPSPWRHRLVPVDGRFQLVPVCKSIGKTTAPDHQGVRGRRRSASQAGRLLRDRGWCRRSAGSEHEARFKREARVAAREQCSVSVAASAGVRLDQLPSDERPQQAAGDRYQRDGDEKDRHTA